MAQTANQRTPLGIDAFWDKPTPDPPPLRWEKWSAIQIGTACKGDYNSRHSTSTQTRDGGSPVGTHI